MKKLKLIFMFLIIGSGLLEINAQNPAIDSLKNLLMQHTKQDTVRVKLLNQAATLFSTIDIDKTLQYAGEAGILANNLNYGYGKAGSILLTGTYYRYKSDYPRAIEYFQEALKIYKENGAETEIAQCLTNIGLMYWKQGNYSQALENYEKALLINKRNNNRQGISNCLNNIGIIYRNQGHYPQALEYYQKSLIISEELGNEIEIANVLNNIGNIYWKQGTMPKALKYYQRALEIRVKAGDKHGISICYVNIGNIDWKQGNYSRALGNYQRALKLGEEIGNRQIISYCLTNIGTIHLAQGNYPEALEFFQKGLRLKEIIGEKPGICDSYSSIVSVYLKTNNYDEALSYANKSLVIAREIELLNNQSDIYEQLSEIYAGKKNYQKAYENHVLYKELNDSIFNEENIKKITGLEYQYEFEKEKHALELEQQKKDAVHSAEVDRQLAVRNYLFAGFIAMVLLVLVVLRSSIQKRKANLILSNQKKNIEEKNGELLILNKEIQDQNDLIKLNTKMILKLENDNHEIELDCKKKDLEVLNINNQLKIKMKEDLIKELKTLKRNKSDIDTGIQSVILKLKRQIDEETKIDLLHANIDVVGSDFNERIKQQFSDLTKSELELLAYIKLKLSNKQIAIQKNTSPNTINVALHRLKSKCNFDTSSALRSHIEGF